MKPIHDLETDRVKNEAAGCAVPDFQGSDDLEYPGNQALLSVSRDPHTPASIHAAGGVRRAIRLPRARADTDVAPLGRDSERP